MNDQSDAQPFQHLLLAVDGSKNANRALQTAAQIAQQFHSRITLLSVYRHISYTNRRYNQIRFGPIDDASPVELSLKAIAEEVLHEAQKTLNDLGINQIEVLIRRGAPATTILKAAEEKAADTIMMGCRGLGEIEGLLLGSVSHKVNSLSKCTCITVR
ncbi:universal stress protein [Pontibacterium granulatum]|uniref:universal stress protein n=1 Tax=Pontibacterium granulatum TaxID=2036029 RepID=UPI00249A7505|nr:universal stress protein [Pontibacterium granulatum]MDI3324557.1 universal stress protein [Pontibacterium granulatum]